MLSSLITPSASEQGKHVSVVCASVVMPTVEMHVNAQQPPIDVLKMELAHLYVVLSYFRLLSIGLYINVSSLNCCQYSVVAKVSASAMNVNVIEAMEAVSVKYVLKEM